MSEFVNAPAQTCRRGGNGNCERSVSRWRRLCTRGGLEALKRVSRVQMFCVCFTVVPPSIMQLIVPTNEHFRQDQHQIAAGGAIFNTFSAVSFLL